MTDNGIKNHMENFLKWSPHPPSRKYGLSKKGYWFTPRLNTSLIIPMQTNIKGGDLYFYPAITTEFSPSGKLFLPNELEGFWMESVDPTIIPQHVQYCDPEPIYPLSSYNNNWGSHNWSEKIPLEQREGCDDELYWFNPFGSDDVIRVEISRRTDWNALVLSDMLYGTILKGTVCDPKIMRGYWWYGESGGDTPRPAKHIFLNEIRHPHFYYGKPHDGNRFEYFNKFQLHGIIDKKESTPFIVPGMAHGDHAKLLQHTTDLLNLDQYQKEYEHHQKSYIPEHRYWDAWKRIDSFINAEINALIKKIEKEQKP